MIESDSDLDYKLVQWDGDDRENVKSAPLWYRILIALIMTFSAVCVTANSSSWAIVANGMTEEFDTTRIIADLGVSVFTFAVALGPLFGGPLTETYGRRPVYTVAITLQLGFQFMVSFGNSIPLMYVGRMFTGLFGSVFLCMVPAIIGDLFDPLELGFYMNICSVGIFAGPMLGPLICSFAILGGLRWPLHALTIWTGAATVLLILVCPETYEPKLLQMKAKRLRKSTGDNMFRAKREIAEKMPILTKISITAKRPVQLFLMEPMMTLLCIYSGFLISIVYFFSISFPEVFADVYGFNEQESGLSFLGIILGNLVAGIWEALRQRRLAPKLAQAEPEDRLMQMIIGSVLVPIGLFMFAWTIYPSVHWIVPMIATFIFGAGSYLTMNTIVSYIVAAFKQYSASAVACNVFVRCLMSGAFPLFTIQMIDRLGFHWANSLIGFIAVLLAPSSFLLYKFGSILRAKSRFADS